MPGHLEPRRWYLCLGLRGSVGARLTLGWRLWCPLQQGLLYVCQGAAVSQGLLHVCVCGGGEEAGDWQVMERLLPCLLLDYTCSLVACLRVSLL
jgi:hypothetical protein